MRRIAASLVFFATPSCLAQTEAAVAPANVDLTLATDPETGTRWSIWADGVGERQAAHLTAQPRGGKRSTPTNLAGGYQPTLRIVPEWRQGGAAVALTMVQYGAAAVEIALWSLGPDHRVMPLDRRTVAAWGWRVDAAGTLILVTYAADGARLIPSCLRWADIRLATTPCPHNE